jgi:riboflavin-specific deaminase-like protein
VHRIFPPADPAEIAPDDVYADLTFPSGRHRRPYVVVNMVSTVDGKSALGESAAGIGSRTDARLMRQVRAAVDAIMWGAGTLRADVVDPRVDPALARCRRERGIPPQPLAVAVSASLDLGPLNRFFVSGPDRSILFTGSAAPADRRRTLGPYATIVAHDAPTVDLDLALRQLHDQYGVCSLLAEGGPSLNERLLAAGLIDELFWTVAPKLAGGHGRGLLDADEPARAIRARLELVSLFEHQGELYTRYRLPRTRDGEYKTGR